MVLPAADVFLNTALNCSIVLHSFFKFDVKLAIEVGKNANESINRISKYLFFVIPLNLYVPTFIFLLNEIYFS